MALVKLRPIVCSLRDHHVDMCIARLSGAMFAYMEDNFTPPPNRTTIPRPCVEIRVLLRMRTVFALHFEVLLTPALILRSLR